MSTFSRFAFLFCCSLAACAGLETAAVAPPAGSGSKPDPTPGSQPPPSSSPLPSMRIAAGATLPFTDPAGNQWAADDGFSGGVAVATHPEIAIDGTDTPSLYNHE